MVSYCLTIDDDDDDDDLDDDDDGMNIGKYDGLWHDVLIFLIWIPNRTDTFCFKNYILN